VSRARAIALVCLAAPALLRAQAAMHYAMHVDANDLATIRVEMRIPASADTLRLAMATHEEVDDRFWRYIRDLRAESGGAPLAVVREDSAIWRVARAAGDVTISYAIALPRDSAAAPRRSWQPFLTAAGGLAGGIDCFLYVPGRTALAATVTVDVPEGWRIATPLEPAPTARTFAAPDAATLLDSPFLLGRIHEWKLPAARVAYLPAAGTVPFDSAKFLDVVQRITTQAVAIFGAAPYKDYVFFFIDGAGGTLEHVNSLVLGVSGAELARDPAAYATEIAHEYFHTWNLIRLHPAGLRGLRTGAPPRVAELWWSEGITIFFADEILLRAQLYPPGPTRATRLAARIGSYLANPGYTHVSPERASLTAGLPPGANGDYSGDYYLSGELTGDLLELTLRDSTAGARGMDQLMAALYQRAAGEPGYTLADIERTANAVCGCELRPFFERHVRNATVLDFDEALRGVGYRTDIAWLTAKDSTGRPRPDTRVFVMRPDSAPPDSPLRFGIIRPTGAWAAAGLHSGDELIAVNGRAVTTAAEFRRLLTTFDIGEHVKIAYTRGGRRAEADVMMDAYVLPRVTLLELPGATPEQLARRAKWLAGE
jgi:predicted metalloprotease with PDZ domain